MDGCRLDSMFKLFFRLGCHSHRFETRDSVNSTSKTMKKMSSVCPYKLQHSPVTSTYVSVYQILEY